MYPRILGSALAGAALSALLAGALAAQDVQGRDALWFGLGLGPGLAGVQCTICRANRGTSLTADARLGGRLSAHVLVGVEATVWAGGVQSGARESMWGVGPVGYFFPHAGGTFYWKAGFGYLSWHSTDGQDVLSADALGVILGTGWEFRIARRLTLAPYVSLFTAPLSGNIKFNGAAIQPNVVLVLAQAGISLTRH